MLESSIGEKLKSNNVPSANRISPANNLKIKVIDDNHLKKIIKESLFEFFSEKYEDTLKIYESLKPIG